jgi:hypothetical protein
MWFIFGSLASCLSCCTLAVGSMVAAGLFVASEQSNSEKAAAAVVLQDYLGALATGDVVAACAFAASPNKQCFSEDDTARGPTDYQGYQSFDVSYSSGVVRSFCSPGRDNPVQRWPPAHLSQRLREGCGLVEGTVVRG